MEVKRIVMEMSLENLHNHKNQKVIYSVSFHWSLLTIFLNLSIIDLQPKRIFEGHVVK